MAVHSWNPFNKEEQHVADPEVKVEDKNKAAEPTAAEMIASALKDALSPVTSQLTAFQTKLDAVEASTKRPAKEVVEGAEHQGPPSVFDNEDAAFNQRIGPVVAQQLAMEARLAYSEVKQEYAAKGYGEVLAQWEPDVERVLEGSPLVTGDGKRCRGDKVYIRNVINMVFGQKAMESNVRFGGRDKGFFVESAGGSADGHASGGPVNDGLTPDQRRVFNRMKGPDGKPLSQDAIKSTMSKLKFVSN